MKRWISILLIVIVVISVSAGGILGTREFYFSDDAEEGKVAEEGDTVRIHYTGLLRDDRVYDGWRIFDTSYNDIPKIENPRFTLTYNSERDRGEAFEFTIGGGVIDGWNENVRGMEEGESQTFEVPPEKGYGEKSEDLIFELDKNEMVPVYQRMDKEKFTNRYGEPKINMIVEDAFWTWEKVVISMGSDFVELRNDPEVGEVYGSYSEDGWRSEVKSIDSNAAGGEGIIEVEHHISRDLTVNSEVLSNYKERFGEVPALKQQAGQSSGGEGIVMRGEDGIVIDFNDEVNGSTLVFRVEVISIEKAGEGDQEG
ncbi:MAG: FKBP-type peptidyl-prolyl cis-trans isomerase [Candidatus Thermoplasmatota archaeon]